MPIYTYRCEKCDELREAIRKADDRDDEYRCPGCGAVCKRKFTAVRFHRGSGWASRVDTPMPQTEDRA